VTRYLLDTNVLSEVLKKRPDGQVLARLREVAASSLYTSSVCVMELRFGAARVSAGAALWRRIRDEALSRVQILGVGEPEAVRAGELLAAMQVHGQQIGTEDVLIAATALTHDLVMSTRNVKHFARVVGLQVEDWWR
jgi:tRNA(fMet)-specific endonuclease VapC